MTPQALYGLTGRSGAVTAQAAGPTRGVFHQREGRREAQRNVPLDAGAKIGTMKLSECIQLLALLGALVLLLCTTAAVSAQPGPFVISGYVTYENGTACNGSSVTVTNLNTSSEWQAENASDSHYYQLILANGTDVNATEQLQFQARAGSGQSRHVIYTVSIEDVARGGLLNYNLSLTEPGRQTWYFTSNDALSPLSALARYNKTMTKDAEGGNTTVTLAPGECVWFYADEVAMCTVPFPAGTWDVRYWVIALHDSESDTMLYTQLQDLTPEGGNTTIAVTASAISYSGGALQELDLALPTDASFSVPAGGRFAVALCWPANATGNLEIHCNPPERYASCVTSPYSDPGYPVPELPSVLLLGLGLLMLIGLGGWRGKRRLGT